MENLKQIRPYVDLAVTVFEQKHINHIKMLILILHRHRPKWDSFFDDFKSFLYRIEKADPDYKFVSSLSDFLSKKLGNPIDSLYTYLEKQGYNLNELSDIEKTYDEGAFLNRLPNNPWLLKALMFYLFQPRLTLKFFLETFPSLSISEQKLLSNFEKLSNSLQEKVLAYTKELVIAAELEQLKKSSIEIKKDSVEPQPHIIEKNNANETEII